MFRTFLKQHSFTEYDFCSDFLPSVKDRDFWQAFRNEECIALAEQEPDYAWPVIKATDFMEFKKSGNRMIMEAPHFDRRRHLVLFALAELKENRGRFLPQIVNGLFAICEESFWGLSAHWPAKEFELGNIPRADEPYIDLFVGETSEQLSVVTALLREPLRDFCPEILDRVEYELERRIKAPYLVHRDWWWMGYGTRLPNNWNPWILSNLLTVFLLTETNSLRLQRALTKMFTEIQFYYDSMPEDGGCDEGPGYWGRAGASLFEFVYQLKQSTKGKLDLFADEKLGRIGAYLQKVHLTQAYFVNVADAHAVRKPGMLPLLYAFARETKQEELMRFAASIYCEQPPKTPLSHQSITLRRLIYVSEVLKEFETCPKDFHQTTTLQLLPNMELAVLRRGVMILAAKGGHNKEHHNHNDVGSFVLYDDTTPVLIDVGIGTYTRFTFSDEHRYTMIPWTRSSYHNLPLVNGAEQCYGVSYRADRFLASEEGITVSCAGAYPRETGVCTLTRSFSLRENGMECLDRFEFSDPAAARVTEVLMSALPVRIEAGTAIIGERYRVCASCGDMRLEFVPFEDTSLERDWSARGVTRILIDVQDADEVALRIERL